ncbi:hypothetical protein [Actinocatenispora rupis]|uniref:PknH-like extracellular domain-containing protein n=1 Tax=Actinocatenispora rupis TaxID=519421 RepID=A0A8J3JGP8_9ACTN|nr:hypothetical protein [Actinocatenispora rupis]GID16062.1 hypothetical protein Aru02nite_69510 [Actinocatenispora rupis]
MRTRAVLVGVALTATLAVTGCQPSSSDGRGSERPTGHGPSPSATTSTPPPGRPRIAADQLDTALLSLPDLPTGYVPDHGAAPRVPGDCYRSMEALFRGARHRSFTNDTTDTRVTTSVQVAAAGGGHAVLTGVTDTARHCRHVTADLGNGRTVGVTLTVATPPADLTADESVAVAATTTLGARSIALHAVVFRYGDNVGAVGLAAPGDRHVDDDLEQLARTAYGTLRRAAR